jgi:hypothetical protein
MESVERRIARLQEQLGEAENIPTLEDAGARYVSSFADAPPRIVEIAKEEVAYAVSLGERPQTEDEQRYVEGRPPNRQAEFLLFFRLLWRRPEGLASATSEHVLWTSRRRTVRPD